ncbi:MAG: ATP-binding cassette domain-containing protein [Acidimicrobiales bacterium]
MLIAERTLVAPQPTGEPPVLSVRDVSVSYGALLVLDGVSFDVGRGRVVGLVGENGAGKSTLVRCIAGDRVPDSGEVLVGESRVRSNADAMRNGIAVVWQDLALCDNLDIATNLFLGREGGRWLTDELKARVAAQRLLSAYDIDVGDVSRPVRWLSGGQRQLVAVARAMQDHPRLLVLDEPTASLGASESKRVEELIGRLQREGTSILLVSHDVDQVFRLADSIVVMRRGRAVAQMAPTETYPDEVVAIMSGHEVDATARRQLSRLQSLIDQLASAKPTSSLPLIISALGAALRTEQLCIHLAEEGGLRCAAAIGLPTPLLSAWARLPANSDGGPVGMTALLGRVVVEEDVETSSSWSRFRPLARDAGIRSSWSVPVIGSGGLIGVLTGCQPLVGRPRTDQMDLVALYAGYAAGVIERDHLFAEVTTRNRVLETIREVLETLAGPEPVSSGLAQALRSLWRGLRASGAELWVRPNDGELSCLAAVDADGRAQPEPEGLGTEEVSRVLGGDFCTDLPVQVPGSSQVLAVAFDVPRGRAALIARWAGAEPAAPDDAAALLGDAANSVRLALERDEAEQAHRQAAALRRSHKLQRDFLSRLSHELRTPLTAIRGYAGTLLAADVKWDDDSKQRFLSRIETESARLGRLVGDLLDFSAIESGLLRLEPDWCDLQLVLEAAISCLPLPRSSAVSLRCSPAIAPIWADHDRLEQVFVNLVENAVLHNPPGTHVSVDATLEAPGHVVVRVSDDGAGLPTDLAPRIFELQSRDHHVHSPGVGLGLSIAYGIVDAHGGEMTLERNGAGGACFAVRLPVEVPTEGAE